jgi:hypothetical protein
MNSTPVIVGLVGRAGSGKDSVATALARFGFCSLAFADALRIEISQAWRMDQRMLTDRVLKERPLPALAIGMCTQPEFMRWALSQDLDLHQPRSARWLMQQWGTDFRRAQNPDYWVRVVEQLARRKIGTGWRRIVITDVRMTNEVDLVHRLGGALVRVHRPDLPPMPADTAGHDSEAHGGICTEGEIHNDGTLLELEHEVQRVLLQLFPNIEPIEVITQ